MTVGRPKGTTEPLSVRLHRNSIPVTESGCWIWLGELCDLGYGLMRVNRVVEKAHRISWQEFMSPIPAGLKVLHQCDVRCCINPDHLFLGTQADNVADMMAKGRNADTSGHRNGRAKLTEQQVREIRSSPQTLVSLGRKYGVGKSTIAYARNGNTWRIS